MLKTMLAYIKESLDNTTAEEYHAQGVKFVEAGAYKDAIEKFTKAIKLDSNNTIYFNSLGNAYYKADLYKEVIDPFTQAIKLDRQNVNSLNADSFSRLVLVYIKLGSFKEALDVYFKAIDCSDNDNHIGSINNFINQSWSFLEKIKLISELIIPCYQELIERDIMADTNTAHLVDAIAEYIKLTKNRESELIKHSVETHKKIASDKIKAEEHCTQGFDFLKKSCFQSAIDQYKIATALDPTNAACFNDLGYVYYNLGLYKKALNQSIIATKLDSNNAEYFNHLGCAHQSLGACKNALDQFIIAARLNSDKASYVHNAGYVHFILGSYEEAIDHFNMAIKIDPKDARFFNSLGKAYHKFGSYEEAIEQYNIATSLDPKNTESFFNLGNAYIKLGLFKEALDPCSKSVYSSKDSVRVKDYMQDLIHKTESHLEKMKLIVDLLVPFYKKNIEKKVMVDVNKMHLADTIVKYTELTKVGERELVNLAIKLYRETSISKMRKKAYSLEQEYSLIEENKRFEAKIIKNGLCYTFESLDGCIQSEIICTKLDCASDARQYHVKASVFFQPVSQELQSSIPNSLSKISDLTNIIQDYLFAPFGNELTGAKDILDIMGGDDLEAS